MRNSVRGVVVVTGVLLAGLLAAACSSSPSKPSISIKGSTTTVAPSTSTSTTTSTTAAASSTACQSLTAFSGSSEGAAGTIVGTIIVTNTGAGSCTIMGYPTLTRFATGGATVPVTMSDGITIGLSGPAAQPPALVTMAHGAEAEFTYQYSDVPSGTETTCASSATLAVTTPGESAASAPFALTMAPCDNGTVRVSPVYSGTAPV
jgi:hypothetical protein